MTGSLVAVAVAAFVVTLALTPVAIRVARGTGIMDRPGELKEQSLAVPYLGGVAVFAGLSVGVLGSRPSVLIPLVIALALGVADDRLSLPPWVRLVGEVAVGIAVVATCPIHAPGWLSAMTLIPLTVLLVNGVNLMDGLDMLAGGVTAVAAIGFAIVTHGSARQMAVALAAALAGFLYFNRPPAKIYLGDGGSYLLGTALTILVAASWAPQVPIETGVAVLALVALPSAEVAFAVVRRLRGRRSLMAGDRGHPYDRLVARGWERPTASAAYIATEGLLMVAVVVVARSSLVIAVAVDIAAAVVLTIVAGAVGALTPDTEVSP